MIWISRSCEPIDKEKWHKWFAWFPVCVEFYRDGGRKIAWLQKVRRKGEYWCGWDYKYKL